MALKLYNDTDIQAIADAIRQKNGLSDTYTVAEMAAAILALNVSTDPIVYVVPDLKACTRMSYAPGTTATTTSDVVGNDNGGLALSVITPNEWSFNDRSNPVGTYYLIPIPGGCNKVTVSTTDTSIVKYKFAVLNSQNGTLTRVTNTGYVDENTHQWAIGTANYICISCIYSIDGTIKPAWDYDSSKITVTFTNS